MLKIIHKVLHRQTARLKQSKPIITLSVLGKVASRLCFPALVYAGLCHRYKQEGKVRLFLLRRAGISASGPKPRRPEPPGPGRRVAVPEPWIDDVPRNESNNISLTVIVSCFLSLLQLNFEVNRYFFCIPGGRMHSMYSVLLGSTFPNLHGIIPSGTKGEVHTQVSTDNGETDQFSPNEVEGENSCVIT